MQKRISPFLSLRVSNFRNYLFGAAISEIGNQMQIVAVAWQVYELTGNPVSLGLIGVAHFLPILLFSLPGGLITDKIDRKKLLITGQGILALFAFVLFITTQAHVVTPPIIYIVLVFVSTVGSFAMPVRQAILPSLVPKEYLMNAVSLNSLQYQASTLIGPAIGGFLIAGFGVGSIYLVNVITFLLFMAILLTVKVATSLHTKEVVFHVSSIVEGIRFVASMPILYMTMILDFLVTFFGTATILMPVFAKEVLHVGPESLGFLYAAPAFGAVLAGIIFSSFHQVKNQGKVILAAVTIYGLAIVGFGFSNILPLSFFFLAVMGAGDMVSAILRNTIRQMLTPDHLRGRMTSIMRIFFQGGPQLGEMEAGFLAALIGGPVTVVIGGVGVLLTTGFIAWRSKSLRNYHGKEVAL